MKRLIWLLVDGLPFELVERFATLLPTLGKVIANGNVARLKPCRPNCQTPPSLHSLYSGLAPEMTGVTGYFLPRIDSEDPLSFDDAFSMDPAGRPEYIWGAVARNGGRIRLCHIPFAKERDIANAAVTVTQGFGKPLSGPTVHSLEASFTARLYERVGATWTARLRDGNVVLSDDMNQREIHLAPYTTELLDLGENLSAEVSLVFADGSALLLEHGMWRPTVFGDAESVRELHAFCRNLPFQGATYSRLYRESGLGETLHDGGDGTAEKNLVFAVRSLARRFQAELLHSVQANDADLVMGYLPTVDLVLHELLGFIDPGSTYATAHARKLVEPLILEVLEEVDSFIASILKYAAPDIEVLVSADHGMAAIHRVFYPNTVLAQKGWLNLTHNGSIDVQRSRCFYHPAENGLFVLNQQWLDEQRMDANDLLTQVKELFVGVLGTPVEFISFGVTTNKMHWDSRNYLQSPVLTQAKADIKDVPIVPSRKTGDHCVYGADAALFGFIGDMRGGLLQQCSVFETWELGVTARRSLIGGCA
ncbi:alkaline phosphatase family protein [Pseudomonas orientalis]|uniref:Type I phosphodiesterase / nucleotide pyrophosphatase n=1 Tax=Pseudomonas orientalis TaxID=76758 RepID=A0A8B3Y531_9PSED|nr:alkaline phosphatase family protein [Pseudomonas orientalis]SDU29171.1 Type I phosphodiesterase / nucleotide pyrophosphatase [Pseudomonas orientalis]